MLAHWHGQLWNASRLAQSMGVSAPAISRYLDALEGVFMLCGDINIAHQEIDLKNYKGNRKNSGFLPEERAWMTEILRETELAEETLPKGGGVVDFYRRLHPKNTGDAYTCWSNCGQPPPRMSACGSTINWLRPAWRRLRVMSRFTLHRSFLTRLCD